MRGNGADSPPVGEGKARPSGEGHPGGRPPLPGALRCSSGSIWRPSETPWRRESEAVRVACFKATQLHAPRPLSRLLQGHSVARSEATGVAHCRAAIHRLPFPETTAGNNPHPNVLKVGEVWGVADVALKRRRSPEVGGALRGDVTDSNSARHETFSSFASPGRRPRPGARARGRGAGWWAARRCPPPPGSGRPPPRSGMTR